MWGLNGLLRRQRINRWRDDFTLATAATLNRTAIDILDAVEPAIQAAGIRQCLFGHDAFVAAHVTPRIREIAEPITTNIVQQANRDLATIAAEQAVWEQSPSEPENLADYSGWQDLAVAAGPLAGGTALAVALPGLAVTTTTAWFGLVSTSVISWPVVVVGGTAIGVALATGVHKTALVGDKARSRLRKRVRRCIVRTLIESEGQDRSVFDQMKTLFAETAERAKRSSHRAG